jgi:hypothetical protein
MGTLTLPAAMPVKVSSFIEITQAEAFAPIYVRLAYSQA